MSRYQKVIWHHDFLDEPVLLYSERGTRKVDVYRDGRRDFPDRSRRTGTARLSEAPMPSMEEIAAYAEFPRSQLRPRSLRKRLATSGK
jgi:hypothetical protein